MVRNIYNEPNKVTLVRWVDKALDLALSKKNIKNGFQVTKIWPLNPKAMDGRTKPNELYTTNYNNGTLDENNVENSDGAMNGIKSWGENGIATKLINITTTTDELATTRANVDGQEQLLRYYVEEPTSLGNLEDTRTEGNLDYVVYLFEPKHAIEEELLHSRKARAPLCLHNLLSLSHLPTRKTSDKKPQKGKSNGKGGMQWQKGVCHGKRKKT